MSPIFVVNLGLEGTEACKIETQEVRFLTTLNIKEPDHPQKKGLNFKKFGEIFVLNLYRGGSGEPLNDLELILHC